jgi:ribonuclease Z
MSKRKILVERTRKYDIPLTFYSSLQNGLDYITPKGEVIKNDTLTAAPENGKRYAFCADTRYDESIIEHIYGYDTIYHETTYLDNLSEKAFERFHSTTKQAAAIAKKAMVNRLLIGHFSSKYSVLDAFAQEAKEVFYGTELAIEGTTYDI